MNCNTVLEDDNRIKGVCIVAIEYYKGTCVMKLKSDTGTVYTIEDIAEDKAGTLIRQAARDRFLDLRLDKLSTLRG